MTPTLARKKSQFLEDQIQMALSSSTSNYAKFLPTVGIFTFHEQLQAIGGARTEVRGCHWQPSGPSGWGCGLGCRIWCFCGQTGIFMALSELKSKGGRPSDEQYQFMDDVNAAGGYAAWTDDLDRALAILAAWQLIR